MARLVFLACFLVPPFLWPIKLDSSGIMNRTPFTLCIPTTETCLTTSWPPSHPSCLLKVNNWHRCKSLTTLEGKTCLLFHTWITWNMNTLFSTVTRPLIFAFCCCVVFLLCAWLDLWATTILSSFPLKYSFHWKTSSLCTVKNYIGTQFSILIFVLTIRKKAFGRDRHSKYWQRHV